MTLYLFPAVAIYHSLEQQYGAYLQLSGINTPALGMGSQDMMNTLRKS